MTKLSVGLCQMPVTNDKDKNLETAGAYISRCAEAGAQLVVLPEMFCCPYKSDVFPIFAEKAGEKVWSFLSETAKKHSIYLVGGSSPELDDEGHIFNTCYIFNEKGAQIGRHRKMHLFDIDIKGGQRFMESETLTAGNEMTVVDTAWGKIGIMICFDMRFPELARLMALEGAAAIIIPAAFNMTTGPAHWEMTLRARAVDNQLYVLACAPARDINGVYVSYGNSMTVSPWGTVLSRLDAVADILLADLTMDDVIAIRSQLPLLSARRSDIYDITSPIFVPLGKEK
jgi:predicted amidohydrolase